MAIFDAGKEPTRATRLRIVRTTIVLTIWIKYIIEWFYDLFGWKSRFGCLFKTPAQTNAIGEENTVVAANLRLYGCWMKSNILIVLFSWVRWILDYIQFPNHRVSRSFEFGYPEGSSAYLFPTAADSSVFPLPKAQHNSISLGFVLVLDCLMLCDIFVTHLQESIRVESISQVPI